MAQKVLLLNPPGKQSYIRDYYCSKSSKSNYLFHPIDLLMLSGRLADRYELQVIDAIADQLSPDLCLKMIAAWAPAVIIALVGAVSIAEDRLFLKKLKDRECILVVSGDAALGNSALWLERHPFIDAILLDFTSEEIIAYLEGNRGQLQSIVFREGGELHGGGYVRPRNQEFEIPIPRHELFSSRNYRFPFIRHKHFATVLTDYGCPFHCSFCVMSTLGYRYRKIDNVAAELKVLKEMGKRELFFGDQTFGCHRQRALELCTRMAEEEFNFGWVCFSRVDMVSDSLLQAMKKAGCHTIIFGVESASEEILKKYRKGYTKKQIQAAFQRCRQYGLQTVATFILGLPEETRETANETLKFLKELDCDFASFNVAVPRMNTPFRAEAIREGLIPRDLEVMDQTGAAITMPSKHLTLAQIQELKWKAIRGFYLRPAYLWNRLWQISSFYEFKEKLAEGINLLTRR